MQKVKEIDLARVWQIIKRDRKKVFITTGITTLLAIIYCIFATPIFTGRALINPPKLTDASNSGFINLINGISSLSGLAAGGLMQKADTDIIAAVLNSDSISDMVIKKFDLMKRYKKKDIEYTRKALDNRTTFRPDIKSGFLEIDVDDPEPKVAQEIANYYIVVLGQLINNIAYSKNMQKTEFFATQLQFYKDKLIKSQESLVAFENKNGISAGQQVEISIGLSTQLQSELIGAQAQLAAISHYETSQNPEYQKLQATVNGLKAELEKLSRQTSYGESLPALTGLGPSLAAQFYNLYNDVRTNAEVYNIVTKQYQSAQIDALGQIAPVTIQVISYATLPIHKSKPKRLYILLFSIIFGIFIGSMFVLVKNRKDFL